MSELSLYDIVGTEGVATDISHINTGAKVQSSHNRAPVCQVMKTSVLQMGRRKSPLKANKESFLRVHNHAPEICHVQVSGFTGPESLGAALYGCHLVVIPAGVPRKPGMTRDDLFNINASELPTPLLDHQCQLVFKAMATAWH